MRTTLLLWILIAFAMICGQSFAVLFSDDFEGYSPVGEVNPPAGNLNTSGASGYGWYGSNFAQYNRITLVDTHNSPWDVGGSQSAALVRATGAVTNVDSHLFHYFNDRPGLNVIGSMGENLSSNSGILGFSWDFYMTNVPNDRPRFDIFGDGGVTDAYRAITFDISWVSGSDFNFRTYDGTTAVTSGNTLAVANEWYRVVVSNLSLETKTYDLELLQWNGGSPVAVMSYEGLGFYSTTEATSTLAQFRAHTSSNQLTRTYYIDNFAIFSEPDTSGLFGATIYFDLGDAFVVDGNWNTIADWREGVHIDSAVDAEGNPTSVSYNCVDGFAMTNSGGETATTAYPSAAGRDSFYLHSSGDNFAKILIGGLTAGETYDFKFFGSRAASGPRALNITIAGQTVFHDSAYNKSNVAVISGVTADESGVVAIEVRIAAGSYGYLGVIEINGNFAAPAPQVSGIFVAPWGLDSNPGTYTWPKATIAGARNAVRELKNGGMYPAEGVAVYLREGTYYLQSSFQLEQQDSGNPNAPVVYQPYDSEQVILSGGVVLSMSDFETVTDAAILDRLPPEARGNVKQVNLISKGVTEYGQMPLYGHGMHFLNSVTTFKSGSASPELFYNGGVMTISRWPNEDYYEVDSVVDIGSIPRNWMDDMQTTPEYVLPEDRENPARGFTIKMLDSRMHRWVQAEDMWMFGFWWWDWSDQSVQVSSVDTVNNEITTVQPSAYGVRAGQRFYVYNLLEEIDVPGEWYLNRDTGILYIYPPYEDENAVVELSILTDPMITMTNVSNVTFKGLNIGVSRGMGIRISGGNNNLIDGCKIGKLASSGIMITGGTRHGVIDSTIYDTGAGGITLVGGDRQTLTPAFHYAKNNHIHNYSRIVKTYSSAIGISGVGNIAANNKIHDGAHVGITFGGNDHTITYNEIFDVIKESQDMGAIYAGRDMTARGNIIKHNFIHSISGVEGGHSNLIYGIYFDDMFSGSTVFGNVFYNLPSGVHVNGGRNNLIDNNIFIDISNRPIMISTTGFMTMCDPHWATHSYGLVSNPSGGPAVPWNVAPYTKYPNLADVLEDEPKHPKYNSASRNVFYQSADVQVWLRGIIDFGLDKVMSYTTIENNFLAGSDPGFVDAAEMNFNLLENSQVFTQIQDFAPIPFDRIGLLDWANPNADGRINFAYFSVFASQWNHADDGGLVSDINRDGIVDISDLNLLIRQWLSFE